VIQSREKACGFYETPCMYKIYAYIRKRGRKITGRCILCSRQTSHAKLEETLANLSRPCASTGASLELEGMYFLLKIISTDKLSKLSRSFRRARARLHLGGSDIYFVPSLHKSWHYRGSDGRRMTTSRRVLWGQLNPRIPVIEYLDPPTQCHPWYSESREAYHPNFRFAISEQFWAWTEQ